MPQWAWSITSPGVGGGTRFPLAFAG